MSTPIQSLGRIGGAGALNDSRWRQAAVTPAESSPGFGDVLTRALEQVDGLQAGAQSSIGAFVRGEPVELHQVMAAAEEAGIALELLVEVRNKLTEAYRTVMNMQS